MSTVHVQKIPQTYLTKTFKLCSNADSFKVVCEITRLDTVWFD